MSAEQGHPTADMAGPAPDSAADSAGELAGDVADALALAKRANAMVSALCDGDREWVMSIPARPDDDPDLVIGAALHALEKQVTALRARVAAAEGERDAMAADLVAVNLLCEITPDTTLPENTSAARVAHTLAVRDKMLAMVEASEARRMADYRDARAEADALRAALGKIAAAQPEEPGEREWTGNADDDYDAGYARAEWALGQIARAALATPTPPARGPEGAP